MSYCGECGKETGVGQRFCSKCGARLAFNEKATSVTDTPAPTDANSQAPFKEIESASYGVDSLGAILKRALNNLFNFEGRDNPKQYLTIFAIVWSLGIVVAAFLYAEEAINLQELIDGSRYNPNNYTVGTYDYDVREARQQQFVLTLAKAGLFAIFIPLVLTMAAATRRMHDAGYSAKWLLVVVPAASMLLPIAGSIAILGGLAVLKGKTGKNDFGPPGLPNK